MGERTRRAKALRPSWNGAIRIEGRDEFLSADAGALLLRELDERLGVTAALAPRLEDRRDPAHCTHSLGDLLRTRLYLLALGHRDQDDADRLRTDPALRLAVAEQRGVGPLAPDAVLASQPTHSRLIAALATPANQRHLDAALFDSTRRLHRARGGRRLAQATLDVDSFEIEVHGHQPGSAYNGHYQVRCYHPLVVHCADTGTWVAAALRPGNVHTAAGATALLAQAVTQVRRSLADTVAIRGDAGFPEETLLGALEAQRVPYVFRLKSNAVLERLAAPFQQPPPGRRPATPREWIHELTYQAEPWSRPRRVLAVVLERPGELFLDTFFLVTSWRPTDRAPADVLAFYRQRGTFEAVIGEWRGALAPRLSCHPRAAADGPADDETEDPDLPPGAAANTATFTLQLLAHNLASAWRTLGRPAHAPAHRLPQVRDALLRVAARCVISARRVTVVVTAAAREAWGRGWRALERLVRQPVVT